jgi:hypothetical protein
MLKGVLALNLLKELISLLIYKDLAIIVLVTIKPRMLILIKVYSSSSIIIEAFSLIKARLNSGTKLYKSKGQCFLIRAIGSASLG